MNRRNIMQRLLAWTWACGVLRWLLLCGKPSSASAVQALTEEDEHMLRLLQPASRTALPGWLERHEQLVAEVDDAAQAGGLDVVVYGDSIMEAFGAQSIGRNMPDYLQNKEAWELLMATKYRAKVLAIAGDQSMHLLWRLQNGEGPRELRPKVVTLMIGTNDIGHLSGSIIHRGNASLIGRTVSLAVQKCVEELQQQVPEATVIVFGLLPLQPIFGGGPVSYDNLVKAANAELEQFVQQQASDKLRYKDCYAHFVHEVDGTANYQLMPDGVHPAGPGGEALLKCMLEAIEHVAAVH